MGVSNKSINKNGYTLIELLAIIGILGIVTSIVIFTMINVIGSAKEKSYQVTINNIETEAGNYVIENNNRISWSEVEGTENRESVCLVVQDLIDMGYFKGDVLDSYVTSSEKVNSTDKIYLERDNTSKTFTDKQLLHKGIDESVSNNLCENTDGDDTLNISIEPGKSIWSKHKNVKIKFDVRNNQDRILEYKWAYQYVLEDGTLVAEDDGIFTNNQIEKTINNIEKDGDIIAYLYRPDGNVKSVSEKIEKIDRVQPHLVLNVSQGNKWLNVNRASMKIEDLGTVSQKGGFREKDDYRIYYQWSMDTLNCEQIKANVVDGGARIKNLDVNRNNDSSSNLWEDSFTSYVGKGKVYVCGEGITDYVGWDLVDNVVSADMWLENVPPVIEIGNYTGGNIVDKTVTIPIKINDAHSGVKFDTINESDFLVNVGGVDIVDDGNSVILTKVDNNNYNLTINQRKKNGKVVITINKNSIYDTAGNGNVATRLTPNIEFINTFDVSLYKNGATVNGTDKVIATLESSVIKPSNITVPRKEYIVSGFTMSENRRSTGATISSTSNWVYNYELTGWYTAASGGIKVMSPGNKPSWISNASGYIDSSNRWIRTDDTILYAQWVQVNKTLPTITKRGYTCGWTTNENGTTITYASGANYVPTSNITMYAVCTPNTYTVNLNGNNATTSGTTKVTATFDSLLPNITIPTRKGYRFDGYYSSSSNDNIIDMISTFEKYASEYRINLYSATNGWKFTSGDVGTHVQMRITVKDSSLSSAPIPEFNDVSLERWNQYRVSGGNGTWIYNLSFDITSQMVSSRSSYNYETDYRFVDLRGISSNTSVTVNLAVKGGNKYYDGNGKGVYEYDISNNTTLYAKWTDVTPPTTPEIITMYDLYGSRSQYLNGFNKSGNAYTSTSNDPYIGFGNIGNIKNIVGAYVELSSGVSSSISQQIFYEVAGTGLNETHSTVANFSQGETKLYIPLKHSGNWKQMRFDFGSSTNKTYNVSYLAVAADANQWNRDDIIIRGTTFEEGSGVEYWQYTYSANATETGNDDDTQWVNYSPETLTSIGHWSAERNQPTYLRVCDKSGNCSSKVSTYIKIDKTAPTKPTTMEFVYGDWSRYTQNVWSNRDVYAGYASGSPNPSGSTDSLSGVSHYQISLDNSSWVDFKYDSTKDMYKMSTNGEHIRYFRAVDNAGNAGSSISRKALIDKTAPTISLESTFNNKEYTGTWVNGTITTNVYYSDTGGSGIDTSSLAWRCEKNDTSWTSISGASSTQKLGSTWSAERNDTCYYRICDVAGNCKEASLNVKIDKTAPTVPTTMEFVFGDWSRYTQGNWTNQSVYAANTKDSRGPSGSTDSASGVSHYQISSDGTNWVNYSYAYSENETIYAMHSTGTHTRYFRAVDNAGNVSSVLTRKAMIDKELPTISVSNTYGGKTYSGSWVNGTINSSITFADTGGSGIDTGTLTYGCDGKEGGTLSNVSTSPKADSWNSERNSTTCYYKICDKVGNCKATSNFTIKIDKTAPTGPTYDAKYVSTGASYTSGTVATSTVNTTISSSDTASGVNIIQYVLKNTYDSNSSASWTTFQFGGSGLSGSGSGKRSGTEEWSWRSGRDDTYYFRSCDIAGNCNVKTDFATFNIKYATEVVVPTASAYCKTGLVYNGSAQTITNSAGDGYTFSGNSQTNAGTYTVTAKLKSGYVWGNGETGDKTFSCSIGKANGYVNLSATSGSISYGTDTKTFTISSHHGGTLTVNDNNDTATVSRSNTTVTIGSLSSINAGTNITVTVKSGATTNYKEASATYTLTVNKANGYVNLSATSDSISYGTNTKKFTISSHHGGTLTVSDNNDTATVSRSNTTVTIDSLSSINAGTNITVTVTSGATTNYNAASATYTLSINKINGYITLSATSASVTYGTSSKTFTVSSHHGGTLTVSDPSGTPSASVSNTTVTISGISAVSVVNKVTVTVTSGATTNYNAASATYTLSFTKADCSCSITSSPSLNYPSGVTGSIIYSCSGDGTVYVTSSDTSVIAVGTAGTTSTSLTAQKNGSSSITVGRYAGTNYNSCSKAQSLSVSKSKYTISYDANGGSNAPKSQEKTYGEDLKLSDVVPTRSGYDFLGWSESNNATSATYQPGATFSVAITKNITLYAVWEQKETYTISYDSNIYTAFDLSRDISNSTAGYDGSLYYNTSNSRLTFNGTLPHNMFVSINSLSLSSGEKYEISFKYVSGTCKKNSTYALVTEVYSSSMKAYSSRNYKDLQLPKCGNTSTELNTTLTVGSSGGGFLIQKLYYEGEKHNALVFTNYVVEVKVKKVFDSNSGYSGTSIKLPSAPSKPGYTFKGWYTANSGGSKAGNAGASYTISENKTLYAQWTANTLSVNYDLNGGSGTMNKETYTYGSGKSCGSSYINSCYVSNDEVCLKNPNDFSITNSGKVFSKYRFKIKNKDLWLGCTNTSMSCLGGVNPTIGWYPSSTLSSGTYYERGISVDAGTCNGKLAGINNLNFIGMDVDAVIQWADGLGTPYKTVGKTYAWRVNSSCVTTNEVDDNCSINYCNTIGILKNNTDIYYVQKDPITDDYSDRYYIDIYVKVNDLETKGAAVGTACVTDYNVPEPDYKTYNNEKYVYARIPARCPAASCGTNQCITNMTISGYCAYCSSQSAYMPPSWCK